MGYEGSAFTRAEKSPRYASANERPGEEGAIFVFWTVLETRGDRDDRTKTRRTDVFRRTCTTGRPRIKVIVSGLAHAHDVFQEAAAAVCEYRDVQTPVVILRAFQLFMIQLDALCAIDIKLKHVGRLKDAERFL